MTEFNYVQVDPPAQRPGGRGVPSQNPHREALKAISDSGKTLAFELPAPDDQLERRRLWERHARWIRAAAAEHERGVRIWQEITDDGRMKIIFQDRAQRKPRTPKTATDEQVPGQMDLTDQQRPATDQPPPTADASTEPPAASVVATFRS